MSMYRLHNTRTGERFRNYFKDGIIEYAVRDDGDKVFYNSLSGKAMNVCLYIKVEYGIHFGGMRLYENDIVKIFPSKVKCVVNRSRYGYFYIIGTNGEVFKLDENFPKHMQLKRIKFKKK